MPVYLYTYASRLEGKWVNISFVWCTAVKMALVYKFRPFCVKQILKGSATNQLLIMDMIKLCNCSDLIYSTPLCAKYTVCNQEKSCCSAIWNVKTEKIELEVFSSDTKYAFDLGLA